MYSAESNDLERALQRASLDAWHAETLRLTAFALLPPPDHAASDWLKYLTGEIPELETVQRKIAQSRSEGRIGQSKFVIETNANKIDLVQSKFDDPDLWQNGIPTIGAFRDATETFKAIAEKFIPRCPPISRLAYGTRALLPTNDKETGYRQLSAYLPFNLDEHGSSEFHYRINRPRESKALSIPTSINRLSNWSLLFVKFTVAFPGQAIASGDEHRFCNLELDINTSQNSVRELPKEELPALITEFVELANEIVTKGDVR